VLEAGPEAQAAVETPLPQKFGAYELLEEVARGGMGVVWKARQFQLNRLVALKVIRDSEFTTARSRQRFQIEAEAAAKLDHPNIVPIYEFGSVDGRPFISMKLVEGANLAHELRGKPMEPQRLARLMATLARAVQFAHQRGIIHRDLKPANILVDAGGQPQVTDFGLAKVQDYEASPTLSSDVIGSPNYMSPEQAAGRGDEVTTSTDVYSLGAIMYELLTGRAPFRATTALETMRKVIEEEAVAPELLYSFADRDLKTICGKCMQKAPARRYSSALALAEDLERWLRQEPILARPLSPAERLTKWMRRNPKVAALSSLLLLVLSAGMGGILFMNIRLSTASRQKDLANVRLASNLRDLEWQKVEDLAYAGKRSDALALLSDFLRTNPRDQAAVSRVFSMLNGGNFCLPKGAPFQHVAAVNSVSPSKDGRRIVTSCDDGVARIWDLESGRLLSSLPHDARANTAVFVADDRQVLTSCQDGSVRLWDCGESKVLLEFPRMPHSRIPPALSRDLKRAAVLDSDRSVQVWDLEQRRPVGSSLKLKGVVNSAAFSSDPNVLAVAARDGSVGVWRVEDSRQITLLKKPNEIDKIEFSPDGSILAAAEGKTNILWDTQTWRSLAEFKGQDGGMLMMAFTPDGRRLVSDAYDQAPRIWEVPSGRMIGQPMEAEQPHCYFRIDPDGKTVATRSQSGVVRIWDAITGLPLSEPFEHEGPVTDLAFTPDGHYLLTSSQDGTARVLNLQHRREPAVILKTPDYYASACFTPDGRYVIGTTMDKALKFDVVTGAEVGKPMIHANPIYRMRVSRDGRKLVTGVWNGSARVWDLQTGEPLTPLLQHRLRLYALAFSRDSRFVATGSEDTTARVWDANDGKPISPLLHHDAEVTHVSFGENSAELLTAGVDGTVKLWSVNDGRQLWPEPIRHKGIVWGADWDKAGRRILTASADRSARVWDARSAQPLTPPIWHKRGVNGARFSADDRRILTWSVDGTARVWDSQTGTPISQPMRHHDSVNVAAFSPDGMRVVTGSKDGWVRLWDAASGYPLSEPLHHNEQIVAVEFSSDNKRFLSFADRDVLRVWDVVTPPVPVPPWFCDLVEGVAAKHMTASREAEPISRDLEPLRERLAAAPNADFYSRWANWFLWERLKDPAPEFVP
jgi:WD40 repeat protein/serine/threonine protein kinase